MSRIFIRQKVNKNRGFDYFRIVKKLLLIGLVGFLTSEVSAQVFFRNDFLINHKSQKVRNLGLRFITINVSSYPNLNQLLNGRGGGTLVLDVRALRQPGRQYSYTEIAEKVYVPATNSVKEVPEFLLQQPPVRRRFFMPSRTLLLSGGVGKL
jgi:hypothetical protein